jgi:GTP-binding protein Era
MVEGDFKSGFIALIGQTNVGKSTLLNHILASKVAITSEKAQTTRRCISGIKNLPGAQLIFIDTPGIHEANILLNKYMVQGALKTYKEVDLILFMTDITQIAEGEINKGDQYILTNLQKVNLPIFLLINKVDLVSKSRILPVIAAYHNISCFKEILPVSALTGEGIDKVLDTIIMYLPHGPQYFPEHMLTDQSQEFWLSELIREKVISLTRQELPYATAVTVERINETPGKTIYIEAIIYVERDSQKGIIIGQGGKMLKEIGQRARKEIEELLGSKVFLDLRVKVRKGWRKDPLFLGQLGLT